MLKFLKIFAAIITLSILNKSIKTKAKWYITLRNLFLTSVGFVTCVFILIGLTSVIPEWNNYTNNAKRGIITAIAIPIIIAVVVIMINRKTNRKTTKGDIGIYDPITETWKSIK